MVDADGAILASRTLPTPGDLDSFLPSLHDAIRWLLETTSIPAGVGVGWEGVRGACGSRGGLEPVFAARAIEADAQAAVHRGCDSVLTRLFREQPQLATCRTVFQAAREEDTVAKSIVSRAIFKLAAAL